MAKDKALSLDGANILYSDNRGRINSLQEKLSILDDAKVDGARVSDDGKYLYLTSNNEDVAGPYGPFSGGSGGGGGDNNAKITLTNDTGWLNTSVASGTKVVLRFSWSSIEDELETGDGSLTISVNGINKVTSNVMQGSQVVDITNYLSSGSNTVKLSVSDVYENKKTLSFRISVESLSIESTFDSTRSFSTDISFPYTCIGTGDKTVYFIVDGITLGTETITTTGRQNVYTIPQQTHGQHTLEVYFIMVLNGVEVESNHLKYSLICVDAEDEKTVISSSFDTTEVSQYDAIIIEYQVYNPQSLTSNVKLYVNDELISSLVGVDRTTHIWSYSADIAGTLNMKISSGGTDLSFTIKVRASEIDIQPETNQQSLYLGAHGRSNNEPVDTRSVWKYNDIQAELTGFNWNTNGWKTLEDGSTVLRINGGARVTIPYKTFGGSDIRLTGKTIEFEFATRDVNNYDTIIIQCVENLSKIGYVITAQKATFYSSLNSLFTQYKEEEHLRISFVINNLAENRLLFIYINGIISGLIQYPDSDDFSQFEPADIVIGSDDATVDIYNIRVYDLALSRYQMVNNWIADMQNGTEKVELYKRNDIYDANGNAIISKLPQDLPYMVFDVDSVGELPKYKGDKKKGLTGYFIDPQNSKRNFTFKNAEINVQGTSSQGYPIKNWKVKFKEFTPMEQTADPKENAKEYPFFSKWKDDVNAFTKYKITSTAIPAKSYTLKADYASSEGANNVELIRYYNDLCPYKTPPQQENPSVRQGIDGFPMVIFSKTGDTLSFMGKYNFNDDKGSDDVFGFSYNGEEYNEDSEANPYEVIHNGIPDQSWEFAANDSEIGRFKRTVNATEYEEQLKELLAGQFEIRFPSEWQDCYDDGKANIAKPEKFIEMVAWVASTDPLQATNKLLETPITYSSTTYTEDTEAYRLAKFQHELSKWFNVDDCLFYYLYTEVFLMVDSRVKNAFPSIYTVPNVEEVEKEEGSVDEVYTESGNGRWCWLPYDMDTGIGINNEGILSFGYGLEDTDRVGEGDVYNGQDSVFWNNIRKCFSVELANMYSNLRAGNLSDTKLKLSYDEIEQRFEDHQNKWPAAIFNEDAYFKYIQPLIKNNENRLEMCLGSKEQQRKWWMYNRFRYLDSKYKTGDAADKNITFRVYNIGTGEIYITPYADIYIQAMLGKGGDVKAYARAKQNERTKIVFNTNKVNDLDSFIYSADQIKEVEGLSNFNLGTLDISAATRLQHLNLDGSHPVRRMDAAGLNPLTDDEGNYIYDIVPYNDKLTSINFGGNVLLRTVSANDCINLTGAISMTKCSNLEEASFKNTKITMLQLPSGGNMKKLHLPETTTNLTIINHPNLSELTITNPEGEEDFSNILNLRLENVNIAIEDKILHILASMRDLSRLRLIGFTFILDTKEDIDGFISNIDRMRGIDEQGLNVETPQISGIIKSDTELTYEYIKEQQKKYLDLTFDCPIKKTVKFYSWDGNTLLDTQYVTSQGFSVGSVTYNGITPTVSDEDNNIGKIHYTWNGWSKNPQGKEDEDLLDNITSSINLYASFSECPIYEVNFYDYSGTNLLAYGRTYDKGDIEYTGVTPSYEDEEFGNVEFLGWGTIPYGSVNLPYENKYLKDVEEDLKVYSIMDWPIISFEIINNPDRTHYWAKNDNYDGDYIDLTGIKVESTKFTPSGNQTAELLAFDYEPKTPLTTEDKEIIISTIGRKEGETQKISRSIPIYYATTCNILTDPDRSVFNLNEDYDASGMSFNFIFEDDTEERVTINEKVPNAITWDPEVVTEKGWKTFTINYKGFLNKTQVFGIQNVSSNLEDNDWETISAISQEGLAVNYWAIGDVKTIVGIVEPVDVGLEIPLAWQSGAARFRILAFDHNKEVESNNKHTMTLGLAGFEVTITDFTEVGVLPREVPDNTKKYTYALISTESENTYKIYFYDKSNNLLFHYLGEGTSRIASTGKKVIDINLEATYVGNAFSTPVDKSDLCGIKYSWHKGCNFRNICQAYLKALPEDLQKVIVPVTKSQRDQNYTDYPWILDESVRSSGYDYTTVIESQEDTIYVANWMELTGEGTSGLFTGATNPADESKLSKQFEYYRLGGEDRRLKFSADIGSIYSKSQPTRSFEAFRWVNYDNLLFNYYAYVGTDGKLMASSYSYSSGLSSFVPIFTV